MQNWTDRGDTIKPKRLYFYNAFDICPYAGSISWVSILGFIRENGLVQICDGQLAPSFDNIHIQKCHNYLFKKIILQSVVRLQETQEEALSRQNEHRKRIAWCLVAWRNNKLVLLQVWGNEKVLWSDSLLLQILQRRTEVIILEMCALVLSVGHFTSNC